VTLAVVLYAAFTLICVVGAYLLGAHFRSRAVGVGVAVGVLAFFVLLAVALVLMMRGLGAG
jgi:hypothetical protein